MKLVLIKMPAAIARLKAPILSPRISCVRRIRAARPAPSVARTRVVNNKTRPRVPSLLVLVVLAVVLLLCGGSAVAQQNTVAKQLGVIKAINGNTITLTTDVGADVRVQVLNAAKIIRVAPGQTDLKNAVPIQLMDLQVGDRILVRGQPSNADRQPGNDAFAMEPRRLRTGSFRRESIGEILEESPSNA